MYHVSVYPYPNAYQDFTSPCSTPPINAGYYGNDVSIIPSYSKSIHVITFWKNNYLLLQKAKDNGRSDACNYFPDFLSDSKQIICVTDSACHMAGRRVFDE